MARRPAPRCPFFTSREVGERWLADHPGVAVGDLDAAREVARAYVQHAGRLGLAMKPIRS